MEQIAVNVYNLTFYSVFSNRFGIYLYRQASKDRRYYISYVFLEIKKGDHQLKYDLPLNKGTNYGKNV